MTSPESGESESEVAIISSEPSDLKRETSTGPHKQSPEKPESSTLSTTHLTTSSSEPKHWSRTVSCKSTPPHSPNGTWTTTESTWSPRRARKAKSRRRRDPTELRLELLRDKKIDSLTPEFKTNLVNKDCWLASVQDRASQAELMGTFWKEESLNSTPRRSSQERNDLICI